MIMLLHVHYLGWCRSSGPSGASFGGKSSPLQVENVWDVDVPNQHVCIRAVCHLPDNLCTHCDDPWHWNMWVTCIVTCVHGDLSVHWCMQNLLMTACHSLRLCSYVGIAQTHNTKISSNVQFIFQCLQGPTSRRSPNRESSFLSLFFVSIFLQTG